jgi:hypothetical protein
VHAVLHAIVKAQIALADETPARRTAVGASTNESRGLQEKEKVAMNSRFRRTLFLVSLVWTGLGVVAPLLAGPLEDADAAIGRDDFEAAIRILQPLAEQDQPQAQTKLGEALFERGEDRRLQSLSERRQPESDYPDYVEAAKWYRKAAEQGSGRAQAELGIMYDKGQGVMQNDNEAVQWYRKAADQGDIFGQYLLGNAYEYGTAVLKDTGEAVKWYRKAADGGNGFAQFTLGKMYEVGRGVPQDYVTAYMWYDLAIASLTVTKSSYRANITAHDRDELTRKMTPDQIALAQKLAHEWRPK